MVVKQSPAEKALVNFSCFIPISHCRITLLIYLLLARKLFVTLKETWKLGTSPLLSVAKVEQERSVEGGVTERGENVRLKF